MGRMAQSSSLLGRRLLIFSSLILLACGQKDGLIVPLRRRNGGLISRGLLHNATLPLHGAVKDYGCVSPASALVLYCMKTAPRSCFGEADVSAYTSNHPLLPIPDTVNFR